MARPLVVVACVLGLPVVAIAERANPFEGDAAAISAGAALYAGRCADCHGADAKGSRGPDLTQFMASGATDEAVFEKVRQGVAGSIMPPSNAPDSELWAMAAYLRSIGVMPPLVSTGNARRGKAIFERECLSCHRVGEEGGALGPNLSLIGQRRSREALVAAIRDPSAIVEPGYRSVMWIGDEGLEEGVIKGEDAFSIQVMTIDGRLKGYRKADLPELERQTDSLMPQYTPAQLSDANLENVLAYLGTLRDDGGAGR